MLLKVEAFKILLNMHEASGESSAKDLFLFLKKKKDMVYHSNLDQ